MAVGGLAVPSQHVALIESELNELKRTLGLRGEVKWNTTRPKTLPIRLAYVDYLAALIHENKAHFHIRFAPSDEYDHDGPRKRFDTVSKMHYQLLLHRALRYYGPHYNLHIIPDGGECTRELARYHGALEYEGATRYRAQANCVSRIDCGDSKKDPMLQLLDVPLGALTAIRLGRLESPDMTECKRALAEHAFSTFGKPRLRANSPATTMDFSIWNAVPSRRNNAAPRR
jgi:hypothetical protein